MKKIIKTVCLIILVLFLMGCKVNDDKSSDNIGTRYAERYQMVSLSEAGVIYDNINEGLIYLSTIDEAKEKVFCYLPNCKHAAVTSTNKDPECMAALYEGSTKTAYYEGTIYFFVSDGLMEHNIYKMKTDGAGRELLAELPFAYNIGLVCVFRGDKVYYDAHIPSRNTATGRLDYSYSVVEVDLIDGSYRFVTTNSDEGIQHVNFAGDTMYVQRLDGTRPYLLTVDMNTLEEKVIITTDEVPANIYMAAYDEDSYFYLDSTNYEAGIRNVDKTVEQVLLKWEEGKDLGIIKPSNKGMLYERRYEYEDEPVGTYFMDLVTGEVTNITEEKEKYGIVGYDGYYDVFVAYEFVENEDGGSNMKWSIWSREKVLGEAGE